MKPQVVAVDDPNAIQRCADTLRSGGLIVYPTETLYGIGANALDAEAVRRVRGVKKRGDGKPILVIVSEVRSVAELASDYSDPALAMMKAFWPGPLTLIFRASDMVSDEISQGTGTIGIRIPSQPFCLRLLRECGFPLTSTSANMAGEETPRTVEAIRQALTDGVDLFVDAGELPESLPSTVVDVTTDPPRLVRRGAISTERLVQVLPQIIIPS